jgi:ABC-type multidrug transport system fused ATPase/permease subunit
MSTKITSKFGRDEQVAAVIGALVAAIPAGLLIQYLPGPNGSTTQGFEYFAWLVGGSGLATGWLVWVGTCVVFALIFGVFLSRTVHNFTNTIIMLSRNVGVLQRVLVPLLERSALGVTAGGFGLLYGHIVAYGFFGYVMPIVLPVLGYNAGLPPLADFSVIFAYLLYGQLMGTVYGVLLEAHWFNPAATADEQNAAVVGAVGGGIAGVGVLSLLGGPSALTEIAALIGSQSPELGAALFVLAGLAFGLLFAVVLSRTINDFTNTVIMFSRRSTLTQKLLVPLLTRGALTVTAGSMGLVYGTALGVAVFGLGAAGVGPDLGLAGLVALVVYGQVLGNGYGLMLEKVDASTFVPGEAARAGVVASLGAGVLSGAFVALAVGLDLFSGLASTLGATGISTGFGVWMAISVVLGLAFVAYVSRTINDFTNTVIMFSRRSTITQKLLVPLLTRAALAVTAGSMGLGFGLLAGVAFYGGSLLGVLPATGPLIVVAFLLYGQILGTGYGLILGDVNFGLPSLGGDERVVEDEERLGTQPGAFARWRSRRPFAGGTLLVLGGMIIAAIPIRLQMIQATQGPSYSALGIVFAAMVVACGVFAIVKPQLSTLIGVTGIAMSILSLIGAFGGLVIGMLVGIVGGSLCVAWQEPGTEDTEATTGEERFRWINESERQRW